MHKADYIEGKVYFNFTFLDRNFLYPDLIPLVYIGKNIENSENGDEWYFQGVESYYVEGAFLGTANFSEMQISDFMDNPPKLSILSRRELINIYTLDKIIEKLQLWRNEPDGKNWID